MIAQLDRKISRRCFIRQVGAVGTISAITPTMLFTQCSISNSMSWQNWPSDTQEAFVEAVAWLVEHTLDRLFPNFGKGIDAALKLAKELAVKKVSPKPTPDDFHNSHSSRYVVTNEKYQFDAQRSTKFNCYIKLDEYARAGDLNMLLDLSTAEIMRLRYELVVCHIYIAGYNLLSLMRASSVVNCHFTVADCSFLRVCHFWISCFKVSWSAILLERHCRDSTESSISAMFSQLPCLGV